ncbi:MAG: hypothetical protein M5R36_10930 [Deltaproteobacteria bacterium]|nr:hypothetical protein [Deltaproteobacteria bacterium]
MGIVKSIYSSKKPVLVLDESGDTGARLWDLDQPMFFGGGWLIGDGRELAECEKLLNNMQIKYKYPEGEIKGNKLAKSTRGREIS